MNEPLALFWHKLIATKEFVPAVSAQEKEEDSLLGSMETSFLTANEA